MKINHLRFNRDHQSRIVIIRQSQFDRIGFGFGWMRPARAGQGQPRWLDLSAGSLRLSRINSGRIGIEFGIALLNAFELVTNSFCVRVQVDRIRIALLMPIGSDPVSFDLYSIQSITGQRSINSGWATVPRTERNHEESASPLRCIHGFYQNILRGKSLWEYF